MSRYKNHFLSNAIIRVDFVNEETGINTELSPDVKNVCNKYFPILEAKKIEVQEYQINESRAGQTIVTNKKTSFEWHFFGRNREKELTITATSVFVDVKEYTDYESFKSEFFEVLNTMVLSYPGIKINRLGLRYIDSIDLITDRTQKKDWQSYWNKYISASLLCGIGFADDDDALTRQMNKIEMNYGDYMLRFQYGIHNSDYPAPNKKKMYILDTDVYSVGLMTIPEAMELLDVYHTKAKEWFEKSIKAALRTKMGVIE